MFFFFFAPVFLCFQIGFPPKQLVFEDVFSLGKIDKRTDGFKTRVIPKCPMEYDLNLKFTW